MTDREPSPSLASAADELLRLYDKSGESHEWQIAWISLRAARSAPAPQDAPPQPKQWNPDNWPPVPATEYESWFRTVANGAHEIDLQVRHNGKTYRLCADWLKHWAAPQDSPVRRLAQEWIDWRGPESEPVREELRDSLMSAAGKLARAILAGTEAPETEKCSVCGGYGIVGSSGGASPGAMSYHMTPCPACRPICKTTMDAIANAQQDPASIPSGGRGEAAEAAGTLEDPAHKDSGRRLAVTPIVKAAEPKATSATVESLERIKAELSKIGRNHGINRALYLLNVEYLACKAGLQESARPEAKEAPAGEQGQVQANWGRAGMPEWFKNAHAELTRAGIPEGALDERVKWLVQGWRNRGERILFLDEQLADGVQDLAKEQTECIVAMKERDAARRTTDQCIAAREREEELARKAEKERDAALEVGQGLRDDWRELMKALGLSWDTMRDCAARTAECLRAERDAARQELANIRKGINWFCCGCDQRFNAEQDLDAHIATCEKHPHQKLKAEVERLRKEKEDSVDGYPRAVELMEQRDAAEKRAKAFEAKFGSVLKAAITAFLDTPA